MAQVTFFKYLIISNNYFTNKWCILEHLSSFKFLKGRLQCYICGMMDGWMAIWDGRHRSSQSTLGAKKEITGHMIICPEVATTDLELTTKVMGRQHFVIQINIYSIVHVSETRPKPAYGRQGLDWIVGPGYSFVVFSTNKTMETNPKPRKTMKRP